MGEIYTKTKEQCEAISKRLTGVPRKLKENAGLRAIHIWVDKWKGKPKECEKCGVSDDRIYDWANIDHQYRRILDDYVRMCRSCHGKYDTSKGFRKRKGVYMSVEKFNKLLEIKNK